MRLPGAIVTLMEERTACDERRRRWFGRDEDAMVRDAIDTVLTALKEHDEHMARCLGERPLTPEEHDAALELFEKRG